METPSSHFLFFFLLLLLTTSSSFPDHYIKKPSSSSSSGPRPPLYKEFFELIHPLPSDHLTPSCAIHIIHHTFADTINHPPYSVPYTPPSECSSPWPHVALEFRANSIGNQYDRISGLWLDGAELLRTSTAEPSEEGIYWSVRKDITRYSSLLKRRHINFTIVLENIVNEVYTGAYHVDVTLFFYKDKTVSLPLNNDYLSMLRQEEAKAVVYETPSDLIIPISSFHKDKGHWFRIEEESDIHYRKVRFPRNTRKIVLEIYVSFHGNDEFWYSNPSNTYIRMNNLTTLRGNGAFREVFFTIDGMFVDSIVPFPVIFTGGINPLLWDPAVGIGAFDLPTYDFELTPFLGMLLDGKDHVVGIGVSYGISYWLLDANLHIWLDKGAASVEAKSIVYHNPGSSIKVKESFKMLDGSFSMKGSRKTSLVGWIKSSDQNLTVSVSHSYKFQSSIRFAKNGTFKQASQRMKASRDVRVMNDKGFLVDRVSVRRSYPLKLITWKVIAPKDDFYTLVTNVSHSFVESTIVGKVSSSVTNKQVSNGWMDVRGRYVVSGKAVTNQTLVTRDESGCYVRAVAVMDGSLLKDNSTYSCPSIM